MSEYTTVRTRDQRAAEWLPRNWKAEKVSAFTYRATNKQTGSEMLVHTAYGRIFEVTSDNGETYGMCLLACTCKDAANGALKQGRSCRHAAAAERVEDLMEFEKRSIEAAASFRAASKYPEQLDRNAQALGMVSAGLAILAGRLTEEEAAAVAANHLVEGETVSLAA